MIEAGFWLVARSKTHLCYPHLFHKTPSIPSLSSLRNTLYIEHCRFNILERYNGLVQFSVTGNQLKCFSLRSHRDTHLQVYIVQVCELPCQTSTAEEKTTQQNPHPYASSPLSCYNTQFFCSLGIGFCDVCSRYVGFSVCHNHLHVTLF